MPASHAALPAWGLRGAVALSPLSRHFPKCLWLNDLKPVAPDSH